MDIKIFDLSLQDTVLVLGIEKRKIIKWRGCGEATGHIFIGFISCQK